MVLWGGQVMLKISRTSCFTLLEVILVISIVMVVTAIAFAYVVNTPAGLSLQSAAGKIEELLTSAQLQASLRGTQRNVIFDLDNRVCFISDPFDESQALPVRNGEESGKDSSGSQFTIPESVDVEFPNFKGDRIQFCFYPDGSASGPEMNIFTKGRKMSLTVSQLTGIVLTKEIASE